MKPHCGIIRKSPRLQRMLSALIDGVPHTTRELFVATGSMAVSSDVKDLRGNGKNIETKCLGKNENGRMVFTYQLLLF